jgi:hypothetical protein
MSIDDKILEAVNEYKSDKSIYTITNLFFEDGADEAAQKIYDATKDLVKAEDPENLIDYFQFLAKNGADFDFEKEIRHIFGAVGSNFRALCSLARIATKSCYPEDAKFIPDIPGLSKEIVSAAIAAVTNFYDADYIVELVAGKYQGLHINDVAAAEKFIEDCKGKLTAAEIKKLQKTLKNVS